LSAFSIEGELCSLRDTAQGAGDNRWLVISFRQRRSLDSLHACLNVESKIEGGQAAPNMDVTGTVETKNPNETNKEVRKIHENLFSSILFDKVEYALNDIVKLFDGKYPGYQKCDTEYHDLEHTLQAYLAMARIFDGLIREHPRAITEESVVLGLISALGHDTGFIKETRDTEGSGAKYTLIHVDRSKDFMGKYLPKLAFNPLQIQHVKNIISCTGVWVDLSRIHFTSETEKETGYVLGTADYLGQMSDPNYLEKLPRLYEEFEEGGVSEFASAQDLMKKTPKFFEDFVMKRLTGDFHSVYQFVANHFGGNNLYIEGIERNMAKLKGL
jgi:hypothetical protein